jgi:hypothetical protein
MEPQQTDGFIALALEIVGFLGVLGFTAASGAAFVVWMTKTWLSEKIRGEIKSEYDRELESLKARLKSEYDEKLETHKAQLKAQGEVEIEKLKSELNIAASQRNVRFSNLQERRAEVIAEVYKSLRRLLSAIADYVKMFEAQGGTPRSERARKVVDAANEFGELYAGKQIFIPKSAADKLDQIYQDIKYRYLQFSYGVDRSPDDNPEKALKWLEIVTKIDELSKTAVVDLEDEFRRLLGDDA